MEFKSCWQEESGDWIYQFDVTEEEERVMREVEEKTHMTIQEMTITWLKWLIKNPEEGIKLLLKWKDEM